MARVPDPIFFPVPFIVMASIEVVISVPVDRHQRRRLCYFFFVTLLFVLFPPGVCARAADKHKRRTDRLIGTRRRRGSGAIPFGRP